MTPRAVMAELVHASQLCKSVLQQRHGVSAQQRLARGSVGAFNESVLQHRRLQRECVVNRSSGILQPRRVCSTGPAGELVGRRYGGSVCDVCSVVVPGLSRGRKGRRAGRLTEFVVLAVFDRG